MVNNLYPKAKVVVRSPQGVISMASATVAILGTAGIISSPLSGAIQTLLMAILGLFTAASHATVTTRIINKNVEKATGAQPDQKKPQ